MYMYSTLHILTSTQCTHVHMYMYTYSTLHILTNTERTHVHMHIHVIIFLAYLVLWIDQSNATLLYPHKRNLK